MKRFHTLRSLSRSYGSPDDSPPPAPDAQPFTKRFSTRRSLSRSLGSPDDAAPVARDSTPHSRLPPRTRSKYLVGNFQGNWLYRKRDAGEDFMVYDERGEFMYYVDPTRFGAHHNVGDLHTHDLVRLSSMRFLPAYREAAATAPHALPPDEKAAAAAAAGAPPGGQPAQNVAPAGLPKVALNWVKAPANLVDASLWGFLDGATIALNHGEIDYLFARIVRVADIGADKDARVEVLPSRRRLEVGVLRTRVGMSAQQVAKMLWRMEFRRESVVDEDSLRAVLTMAPTAEEQVLLRKSVHLRDRLDEEDGFMMRLAAIPNVALRVGAALATRTFAADSGVVRRAFATIEAAAIQLRESWRLPPLLALVLQVGNFLNAGTNGGQCAGFKIGFLDRLDDVRSTSTPASLLDVIVELVYTRFPELQDLRKDLPALHSAVRVSLEYATETLSRLRDEVALVDRAAKDAVADTPYADFGDYLTSYKATMAELCEAVQQQQTAAAKALEDVMILFGEKSCKSQSRQIETLATMDDFCSSLEAAGERLHQRRRSGKLYLSVALPQETDLSGSRRTVHWNKVPKPQLAKSVWEVSAKELSGAGSWAKARLPEAALHNLFTVDNSKADTLLDDIRSHSPVEEVLPSRRKHVISILLATCRMEAKQIVAIATDPRDADDVEDVVLRALVDASPTPEEEGQLVLYKEKLHLLDPIDRFMCHLAVGRPNVKGRLNCIFRMRSFDTDAEECRVSYDNHNNLVASIMESRKLHRVLEVILGLGNYLNAGTPRGDVRGFNLDVLPTISHVKSPRRGSTLLEYLVRAVCSESRNATLPIDDLSFPPVTSLEMLSERLSAIQAFDQELEDAVVQGDNDTFARTMADHVVRVKQVRKDLEERRAALDQSLERMMDFFAERSRRSRKRQSALLELIEGFVDEVNTATAELAPDRKSRRALDAQSSSLTSVDSEDGC